MPSLLDQTVGAFLIATFITVYLGGITGLQTGLYYMSPARLTDPWSYKAMVLVLFVLDHLHSVFCCMTMYTWLVTHYGDPTVLADVPWTFTIDPAMVAIVTFICQAFYAYRVYVISGRKYIVSSAILFLSIVQMAFGVSGSVVIATLCESKFDLFGRWLYGVTIWLMTAAVADVLITASLIHYLRKASGSDHQRSNSIVERIVKNTIETNALTMSVAIADAIMFLLEPTLGYHVIANFALLKLYINSVLVSLNSRQRLGALRASPTDCLSGHKTTGYAAGDANHARSKISRIEFTQHEIMHTESKSGENDHPYAHSASEHSLAKDAAIELDAVAPPVFVQHPTPAQRTDAPGSWR